MKKSLLIIFLTCYLIGNLKSQGGGVSGIIVALSQRSTVLYSDTIFTIDGLKFKITETYAFRNKIKTTIIFLNQSNNFKIIHSEDFSIMDSDSNTIVVNAKKPIVIPPGATKKIGLMAESKSFKLYDIKINLRQIYTTGAALSNIKPNLFNLRLEGMENSVVGPLEITRTKFTSASGFVRSYFKLNYRGNNFLAIYGQNVVMLTASRKHYLNIAPKSKITYYPKDKPALTLMFEFDNPAPNFEGQNCDKISFENVFVEYELLSNNKSYEFHTYKNGMNEGDSPFDKKEREDLED